MTVKQNLIAARALIDTPEKWHRGSMRSDGCVCAMGAVADITKAAGRTGWISETREYKALRAVLPRAFNHVPAFNDDPATTHADIMDLFGRAIAACEVAA